MAGPFRGDESIAVGGFFTRLSWGPKQVWHAYSRSARKGEFATLQSSMGEHLNFRRLCADASSTGVPRHLVAPRGSGVAFGCSNLIVEGDLLSASVPIGVAQTIWMPCLQAKRSIRVGSLKK